MKQFTPREQSILIVSTIIISVYLFYSVLYRPWITMLDGYNQEKEKDRRILTKNSKVILKAEGITKTYDQYFNLFQQKKSDEEQMSGIISQLEAIATEMHLRFSEIKPRKVKKAEFYNIFSVSLAMEGNFPTVVEFIYRLQTQPYLFNVEEIHLEKNVPQDNSLQAGLVISRKLISENILLRKSN